MTQYGSVHPTFWTRGTGKKLRGDKEAQLCASYLMSCPAANMIGIFHLSLPQLCNDTGLTLEDAWKGLARLLREGFAFYDESDELFWVPTMARWRIGDSLTARGKNGNPDRRIAGIRKSLVPFKGHLFYTQFLDRYADAYHLKDLVEVVGASKGLPSPHATATATVPDLIGGAGGDGVPMPERPRPRSDLIGEHVAASDFKPTQQQRDYAHKLGLSPNEFEEVLVELLDKHGRNTHTVQWFDQNLLKFIESRARWKQIPRENHNIQPKTDDATIAQRAADRQRADAAERERARQALRGATPTPSTETQARAALDALTSTGAQ
jgi:hypothetical protein